MTPTLSDILRYTQVYTGWFILRYTNATNFRLDTAAASPAAAWAMSPPVQQLAQMTMTAPKPQRQEAGATQWGATWMNELMPDVPQQEVHVAWVGHVGGCTCLTLGFYIVDEAGLMPFNAIQTPSLTQTFFSDSGGRGPGGPRGHHFWRVNFGQLFFPFQISNFFRRFALKIEEKPSLVGYSLGRPPRRGGLAGPPPGHET